MPTLFFFSRLEKEIREKLVSRPNWANVEEDERKIIVVAAHKIAWASPDFRCRLRGNPISIIFCTAKFLMGPDSRRCLTKKPRYFRLKAMKTGPWWALPGSVLVCQTRQSSHSESIRAIIVMGNSHLTKKMPLQSAFDKVHYMFFIHLQCEREEMPSFCLVPPPDPGGGAGGRGVGHVRQRLLPLAASPLPACTCAFPALGDSHCTPDLWLSCCNGISVCESKSALRFSRDMKESLELPLISPCHVVLLDSHGKLITGQEPDVGILWIVQDVS